MHPDFFQVAVLAVIQGFTEFLPISSSAHLLLPRLLLGWPEQGLTFDVAVHLGSLFALVIYFRKDLGRLLRAWLRSLVRRHSDEDSRLAWLLVVATVPGGVAGLLFGSVVESHARSLMVIAVSSLLFALLLWWADRRGAGARKLSDLDWTAALFIGFAQALALIPGASRSGVTMTAALFCGLSRQGAARFSFLLALPIIVAATALRISELLNGDGSAMGWPLLAVAVPLSGLVAMGCIHWFLRLIERVGFAPFVLYRVLLGVALLGIWLSR